MNKLSTGLTLLALTTALAVASPALAGPAVSLQLGIGQPGNIDCSLPQNADDWHCRQGQPGKHHPQQGKGSDWQGNGYGSNDYNGRTNYAPAQDSFSFSFGDRHRFHQNFGFSFGSFAAPRFSVNVGVAVPHSYGDLRPVPRKIYRAYPQFQGYLYFVSQRGDFVIVSPHSHRVVAVI